MKRPSYPSDPHLNTALKLIGDAALKLSAAVERYSESAEAKAGLSDSQDKLDKAFAACLEEYRALRGEQAKRLEVADKNLNYVAIILAATLGGAISLFRDGQGPEYVATTILLVPVLATPFIFTMFTNELMIVRLGVYFYDVLRPFVIKLTNENQLWDWERYHVVESKALMFQLSSFLRRFVYILPSVAPPIIFILLRPRPFSSLATNLLIVDFVLGLLTIVLLLYYRGAFKRAVIGG
jgi:hypothetical protein